MRTTRHFLAFALLAGSSAALPFVPATSALGSRATVGPVAATKLETGKRLYRKYCGQCHGLTVALAAGFGSNKGLGQDGGPSFDTLSVPFNLSIVAVTGQIGGHELIAKRLNWTQLNQVAAYVALVTRKHPIVANVTDG